MAEISIIKNKAITTGGTINIPVDIASGFPECLIPAYRLTGSETLGSNYILAAQGTAFTNQKVTFYNEANFTLSGNSVIIFGSTMPTSLATKNFKAECIYGGAAWTVSYYIAVNEDGWLQTADIEDEAVTVDKMADLTTGSIITGRSNRPTAVAAQTSGQILIGDGTNLVSVAVTGDVTISSAGVTAIGAGAIVNADVNASAAIAYSKLASLTSGNILVGSAGNVPTSVTMSGDATIIASGALTIANDAVTVAKVEDTLTYEVLTLDVSFEAAGATVPSVGDFKIKMPYPGTVTEIYAYCTKAIANTDAGTIQAKNNGGTNMTNGLITYAISDPRGTAYTVNPSANNTFIAGDILTFTTAKVTAGGRVSLSIKVVRS